MQHFISKFSFILVIVFAPLVMAHVNNGQAPDTAECLRRTLCNGDFCADVCVAGTVVVDEWAVDALKFQRKLQKDLPLTYYQMPGTHNGYQTVHQGVGVEEDGMHKIFKRAGYAENNVILQNQRYSVTDQLRMGSRWTELDVWGFVFQYDDLRLCHDPFPDPRLLYWLRRAANEAGIPYPNWDPSNLGCFSKHNKNLKTGLEEINDWLRQPANRDEIIVVYYDAKTIFTPDQVKNAEIPSVEVFGDKIFTPVDKALLFPDRWPSAQELLDLGKQVLIETQSDKFADSDVIFTPSLTSKASGGDQFGFNRFAPFPECTIDGFPMNYGQGFYRALDGSIKKGPVGYYQPDGGSEKADLADIHDIVNCGVSTSGLDQFQPSYSAALVWSWAKNEPASEGNVLMNHEGRWQTCDDCEQTLLHHACVNENDRLDWTLSIKRDVQRHAKCPDGYEFSFPRTGLENSYLKQAANHQKVWLAIRSKEF